MREFLSLWPWRGPLRGRRSMAMIACDVGYLHGLTVADLCKATRRRAISHPRQEAMAQMHLEGFSNKQIVRFFRLTDHTTCVHARKAVADRFGLAQQEAA